MSILPAAIRERLHRQYKKIESKEHQLLYLFLEITRACNLSCRHCGSDCGPEPSHSELTTESWLAVLTYVAKRFSPAPTIVLTGGEPIVHPEFEKIIQTLHGLGLRWGLVSNGYALDQKEVDRLVRCGIYSITLSLDGLEDSHTWLRGKKESFPRVVEAIKIVSSSDIPLKDVVTCVSRRNLHELDSLADMLIRLRIPSWRLFRIFPSGRAAGGEELSLSVRESGEMLDWIGKNRKGLALKGCDLNFSCEGWLPAGIDARVRNHPFFCRAGINIGSILSDGRITGCSNNSDSFIEGNILKDDFAYVWQNRFEKFRNRSWVKETACGRCRQLKICQGSSIHLWRGSMKKPEFCYLNCY
jgi:radical SAM protein with 4Fe4S-binding SPASM domain